MDSNCQDRTIKCNSTAENLPMYMNNVNKELMLKWKFQIVTIEIEYLFESNDYLQYSFMPPANGTVY